MRTFACALLLCCSAALAAGQAWSTNQLTTSALPELGQRALFTQSTNGNPFLLPINTLVSKGIGAENAAVRINTGDKSAFPFLATLPNQGSSVYITALKPCGQIAAHIHPRGTEQYIVLSGVMATGLASELGGPQNITAQVHAGQSFVVPQGLLHYNANNQCTPLVFIQTFDSADPGLVSITASLPAMLAASPEVVGAAVGNFTGTGLGPFALDSACLARCGLSSNGGDLSGLSYEMQVIMGLAGSPASAPAAAGSSG